jgi:hypothetical protein
MDDYYFTIFGVAALIVMCICATVGIITTSNHKTQRLQLVLEHIEKISPENRVMIEKEIIEILEINKK